MSAVESNITKENIEVKAGQVWKDLDKRLDGRECMVVEVKDGKAFMRAHSATGQLGKPTTVSVKRMHKSSTGWALVSKAGN